MKLIIITGISSIALLLFLYSCTEDKWNEKTRSEFLNKCTSEGITEDSCNCILEKIEEKEYGPSSLYSEDEEVKKVYTQAMSSCLGL